MPRHSELVILQDGTEVRREVKQQSGVMYCSYDNVIYIVEEAGRYNIQKVRQIDGTIMALEQPYYRVVRAAVIV